MTATAQYPILDQVVETVETTQARMIEINQRVADTVIDRIPSDRVRLPELPVIGAVPTPAELVDNYFSFASRLNEANHAFSRKLVEAWAAETKPAKKSTAKKSTAKKSTTKKSVEA